MSDELNKDLLKNLREVRCAVHEYLSTGKIYRFNPDLGICNARVSRMHLKNVLQYIKELS